MAEKIDYELIETVYSQYMTLYGGLERIIQYEPDTKDHIKQLLQQYIQKEIILTMKMMPVDRINASHVGIPVSKLKLHYHSLYEICNASYKELVQINGIGENTAKMIIDVAAAIKKQFNKEIKIEFRQNSENEFTLPLLTEIDHLLELREEILLAKKMIKNYPEKFSINDFKCMKNRLAYSFASKDSIQKAIDAYELMRDRLNGEFDHTATKLISKFQSVANIKKIQFQSYLDHKEPILDYLSKVAPTRFEINQITNEVDQEDFSKYHTIYEQFVDTYQRFNRIIEEEKKLKASIKQMIQLEKENNKIKNTNLYAIENYLEKDVVEILHQYHITTLEQIEDLPLATLKSFKQISEVKAVEIKRNASRGLKQVVIPKLILQENHEIIPYANQYLSKKAYYSMIADYLIHHKKEIEVLIKSTEAYHLEKSYRTTLMSDLDIARRCIDKMKNMLDHEMNFISPKLKDDHSLEIIVEFLNSVVPDSYELEKGKKKDTSIIGMIYHHSPLQVKFNFLSLCELEPYCSLAKLVLDQKAHLEDRNDAVLQLLAHDLISEIEKEEMLIKIEEDNDASLYTDIELVSKSNRNIVTTLMPRLEFKQINEMDEIREANLLKLYFIDDKKNIVSNEVMLEVNQKMGHLYHIKFELKNQSYLDDQYKLVIKNKKGAIYQEYQFKFDISFADDFDF